MPSIDLTPFLDARQNQLQLEMAAADAIDTKALGVLASDFAVLLFIAQSTTLPLHSWQVMWIVGFLVLSLGFTCLAIWPREYAGASTNAIDHPEYLTFGTAQLVKQLIADTEVAISTNKKINVARWKLCKAALVLTLVASAALFVMLYLGVK